MGQYCQYIDDIGVSFPPWELEIEVHLHDRSETTKLMFLVGIGNTYYENSMLAYSSWVTEANYGWGLLHRDPGEKFDRQNRKETQLCMHLSHLIRQSQWPTTNSFVISAVYLRQKSSHYAYYPPTTAYIYITV